MVLWTKVLLRLCFAEISNSGAGPGSGARSVPFGCPEISTVARSDNIWRTFCVSWVLWLVWLLFFSLKALFSCTVCLFLLGSVKGLDLAVVVLPLQDLFSCLRDGRRPGQWLWGLWMSCAFLFNITLPFKFPKSAAFSLCHGLLPLDSFLDGFCWKMVMSLWVDFCQNINLTFICSAENYLAYGMINKWDIKYGAETITLEAKKEQAENDIWAKKSIRVG